MHIAFNGVFSLHLSSASFDQIMTFENCVHLSNNRYGQRLQYAAQEETQLFTYKPI
jgi:phage protein U